MEEHANAEVQADDRKVGEMRVDELKYVIEALTRNIYKDIFGQVQLLTTNVAKLENDNIVLRKEIRELREESDFRRRQLQVVEDQVKRKNIIVKGLNSNTRKTPKEELMVLCTETLKLDPNEINVRSVKKIYDRNNKMGIVAELNSEEEVYKVLKETGKLNRESLISVEKDLNSEKQVQKRVMLRLKRDLLAVNRSQRVTVRDERMRIADKWFYWNQRKQLTSGNSNRVAVMKELYGNTDLNPITFDYFEILDKLYNVSNE